MREKMDNEKTDILEFQKISDWLPIILIFGGLGLNWLEIDKYAIMMNFGFIGYGIFGLIDSIKKNYYKHLSLKLAKTLGQVTIIILAIYNFLIPISLMFLLLLVLLDRIILTPNRLD